MNITLPIFSTAFQNIFNKPFESVEAGISFFDMLSLPNNVRDNIDDSTYDKVNGGSYIIHFDTAAIPTTTSTVMEISDGTSNTRYGVFIRTSGQVQLFVEDNNVAQAELRGGSILTGSVNNKLGVVVTNNSFKLYLNGSEVEPEDTSGIVPAAVDRISTGIRGNGSTPFSGNVTKVAYTTEILDDATLIAETT